jgi:hypothetical protein
MMNFALAYFVPPAFVNIKWKAYLIFGCFNVAMFIHVFLAFPETSGKTLEEVEGMFTSNMKPWQTRVEYQKSRREEAGEIDAEKKLSRAEAGRGTEEKAATQQTTAV